MNPGGFARVGEDEPYTYGVECDCGEDDHEGSAHRQASILIRREGLLGDANDELARDVPSGADFLRCRRLLEREGLLNAQAEEALGTKSSNFGEDSLRMFRRPVTELRAVLRSREIGGGKHARSIADDLDQLWDDPRTGDIEGSVHAPWREPPHPFRQARSVGGRDGAKPAHVVVLLRARRADDGNPAETRELDNGRANPTRSSAHQKRLAGYHTELPETGPRRFDDYGEPADHLRILRFAACGFFAPDFGLFLSVTFFA